MFKNLSRYKEKGMGIKNLHHFLRRACPLIYTEVHISKFAYKKIAVDSSIYMCKFKTTYGRQWLDAFLLLICVLRENNVHPIFVYDTSHPIEKEEEKKMRTLARLKTKEKADSIFKEWESYKSTFSDNPEYFQPGKDCPPLPIIRARMSVELSDFLAKQFPENTDNLNVVVVDAQLDHIMNTLLSIRSEDFELTRQLFDIMNIPWIMSTGEAEATCSVLCRDGFVDAVLSEDTDVLNYKAPVFLHRLNLNSHTVVQIEYDDLLNKIDLTKEQFLDFCIMCGTDYNSNIPKIGPEKSYKLLKKFGSIENIIAHNQHLDVSVFPYQRVRELFLDDQHLYQELWDKITYCGIVDIQKLSEFCFHHNCKFDFQRLVKALAVNPYVSFSS